MLNHVDKVGVSGDWHGNLGWVLPTLKNFKNHDIQHIIQVGDFGFIWGGQETATGLRKLIRDLERNDQYVYVVLGNHEDYARVEATPENDDGTKFYRSERILLLPRGYRGTIGGKTFVALGGANSIDFEGRTEWVSWWRAESITLSDVYRTVEGGKADIMFTHDAPAGVIMPYDRGSGGWSGTAIRYSNEGREMLRMAVDAVKPEILFHGHHHVFHDVNTMLNDGDTDYKLNSVGLARDTMEQANIIFTPAGMTYEVI